MDEQKWRRMLCSMDDASQFHIHDTLEGGTDEKEEKEILNIELKNVIVDIVEGQEYEEDCKEEFEFDDEIRLSDLLCLRVPTARRVSVALPSDLTSERKVYLLAQTPQDLEQWHLLMVSLLREDGKKLVQATRRANKSFGQSLDGLHASDSPDQDELSEPSVSGTPQDMKSESNTRDIGVRRGNTTEYNLDVMEGFLLVRKYHYGASINKWKRRYVLLLNHSILVADQKPKAGAGSKESLVKWTEAICLIGATSYIYRGDDMGHQDVFFVESDLWAKRDEIIPQKRLFVFSDQENHKPLDWVRAINLRCKLLKTKKIDGLSFPDMVKTRNAGSPIPTRRSDQEELKFSMDTTAVQAPPKPKEGRVSLTKDQWIENYQAKNKDGAPAIKHVDSSDDEDLKFHDSLLPFGHQSALSVEQIVSIALNQVSEEKEVTAEELKKHYFKTLHSIMKANHRGSIKKQLGSWQTADGEVGVVQLDLEVRISRPWLQISGLSHEILRKGPLDDWNYDILDVEKHMLVPFIASCFTSLRLLEKFEIPVDVFTGFLHVVESNYVSVPYHNLYHAADVTHCSYYFIRRLMENDLFEFVTELDQLCLLISSVCHDVCHPGLNNTYHQNASTSLALLYNDQSILENHHCTSTFKMLRDPRYNILCGLTKENYKSIRKSIVSAILATDIGSHFKLLEQMKTSSKNLQAKKSSMNDKSVFFSNILHAADISNPCKEWWIAKKWSDRIFEEVLLQGDLERAEGLPISQNADRETASLAQFSLGFIDFIVAPLYVELGHLFLGGDHACRCLLQTRGQWEEILWKEHIPENDRGKWEKRKETFQHNIMSIRQAYPAEPKTA
eukprot:TRINITY_DN17978_c0_g1_i2.p1 TRINITY_DN17978_c0_g1~~TRINITY_DN17978_c0_g1_i2.p1  ORF type:complete len:975 (+),score=246.97 TRINITY_DN17978_c0_g1_i2:400-2925(+)